MNETSSRSKRAPPVRRSSSTASEARYNTSPKAAPPIGVAIKSLVDGYSHSMKNSHMPLPAIAKSSDCQKLNPLARAALKYRLPLYGCRKVLVPRLSLSQISPCLKFSFIVCRDMYDQSPCCTYRSNAQSPILNPATSADARQKCLFVILATSVESGGTCSTVWNWIGIWACICMDNASATPAATVRNKTYMETPVLFIS